MKKIVNIIFLFIFFLIYGENSEIIFQTGYFEDNFYLYGGIPPIFSSELKELEEHYPFDMFAIKYIQKIKPRVTLSGILLGNFPLPRINIFPNEIDPLKKGFGMGFNIKWKILNKGKFLSNIFLDFGVIYDFNKQKIHFMNLFHLTFIKQINRFKFILEFPNCNNKIGLEYKINNYTTISLYNDFFWIMFNSEKLVPFLGLFLITDGQLALYSNTFLRISINIKKVKISPYINILYSEATNKKQYISGGIILSISLREENND